METKSISDYGLYIFDLDDTLYSSYEYLKGAFREIAQRVSSSEAYDWLLFHHGTPFPLFNRFVEIFGGITVDECLTVIRTYRLPYYRLELFRGAKELLSSLQDKPVYVLTNGNVEQQKNKVVNINWQGLDKNITFIYANEYTPKPSPLCVRWIQYLEGTPDRDTVLIGDSETDRLCAENAGIDFRNISDIL